MSSIVTEFTISFKADSMHISNGIVSHVYTGLQAMRLLAKKYILIGDNNNVFSIHGEDMKTLHTAIENHWCNAA